MGVSAHFAKGIPFTGADQNRVDAASDSSESGYQTLQFHGG